MLLITNVSIPSSRPILRTEEVVCVPTNVLGITDNLKNFTLLLVVFVSLFVCLFFANSKRERDHLYSVNLNIHGS